MRIKLKEIGNQTRERYSGTILRCGIKYNKFKRFPERTLLIGNLTRTDNNDIVTDHLWVTVGKTLCELDLKAGDTISFDARVGMYRKGKHNTEKDFKLNKLTHIEVVREDREIEKDEITTKTPPTLIEYQQACERKEKENEQNWAKFEIKLEAARQKEKEHQQEITNNIMNRINQGLYPLKKIPIGYKAEENPETTIIIDNDKAPYIRNAYQLCTDGKPLALIVSYLKQKGFYKLSKSKLKSMLQNPVYIGKIKFDKKIYKGIHEAIISEQMFNKAQTMLKKKK